MGEKAAGSKPPHVFVICGPSGVGKSTMAQALLQRRPELATVTSYTTREPRPGDGVGKSYTYVSRDEFERLRDEGGLLEWAEVHGRLYGTPRASLEELLGQGRDVLLEIDVQGAHQLKAAMPEAVVIFVSPPDWETLDARLRARGTEEKERARRLETARRELDEAGSFDHRVVNDLLEQAVEEVDRILERASANGA